MADPILEEFVRKYVKKEKQERLLWELGNARKRQSVFWRFAGPNIFKNACLHSISYMNGETLKKELFKSDKAEAVYYIGESHIGILSIESAIEKASMGEICIIYCKHGIAYYQGEQDAGNTPRFILRT